MKKANRRRITHTQLLSRRNKIDGKKAGREKPSGTRHSGGTVTFLLSRAGDECGSGRRRPEGRREKIEITVEHKALKRREKKEEAFGTIDEDGGGLLMEKVSWTVRKRSFMKT